MPRWTPTGSSIKQLRVFHGTEDDFPSLTGHPQGATLPGFVVNLSLCKSNTDFGQGFYVTTSEHQAKEWANVRCRSNPRSTNAIVLEFELDRDWLASLEALAFNMPTIDFWDLVSDCRLGFRPHQRFPPRNPAFDIVYGPVTLWPQLLVIQACDQISFHTQRAVRGLQTPLIKLKGNPYIV